MSGKPSDVVERFVVVDGWRLPYSGELAQTKYHYSKRASGYCFLGACRISEVEYDNAKNVWEAQAREIMEGVLR